MLRIVTLLLGLAVMGCAPLIQNSQLFEHTALLPEGTIPLTAQLVPLEDHRPEKEQKSLAHIQDLAGKVNAVLLKDFQRAQLFQELSIEGDPRQADLLLRGAIRSFTVQTVDYYYEYTPLVIFAFLGLPEGYSWGQVALALEVVDAKNGAVLGAYEASSRQQRKVTIYDTGNWEQHYGEEAGESFRQTLEKLKRAILADRDRLTRLVASPSNAP